MSIKNITFLKQFHTHGIFLISDPYIEILKHYDVIEITKLLNSLEIDKIYVVSMEFIYSTLMYDQDTPTINLSEPILITKNSNPKIISDFIKERIDLIIDSYFLDDEIIHNVDNPDGSEILFKYKEINLF